MSIDDHIEGATQFQHFIENGDHSEGDFVLQDKLSDWREWMVKNSEPMPDVFKSEGTSSGSSWSSGSSGSSWTEDSLQVESNLSPIEEAQQKLALLEQKQEEQRSQLQYSDRFDEETKAQLLADGGKSLELNFEEPEGETKPMTVAEMLGQKVDTPLIEPNKPEDVQPEAEPEVEPEAEPEVEQEVETTTKPAETTEAVKEEVEDKTEEEDMHYEVNDDDFFKDDEDDEDDEDEEAEEAETVPEAVVEVEEDVIEEVVEDTTKENEDESQEPEDSEKSEIPVEKSGSKNEVGFRFLNFDSSRNFRRFQNLSHVTKSKTK